MNLKETLHEGKEYLKKHEIENGDLDAWYLLQYVLESVRNIKIDRGWLFLHEGDPITPAEYARYCGYLEERGTHRPLQHITGEQEFMGFSFLVNENVLVPRQDTEILVEEALNHLKPNDRVLDMCTGSGCIIISLMKLGKQLRATASDVSPAALEVARENAIRNEVVVDFRQGDLFAPVDGTYEMIVSNPPYIPTDQIYRLMKEVKNFDPISALDGREDGLYFYRELVTKSSAYLAPRGWLIMEIGHDQGEAVKELMGAAGYTDIYIQKDLAGLDRVAAGRMK